MLEPTAKSNRRSLQPRVGVEDEEEESRKSVTMSLNRAKLGRVVGSWMLTEGPPKKNPLLTGMRFQDLLYRSPKGFNLL